MEKKLNYVCVKWGDKYSATYVNKLYFALKKFSTKNFNFFCYTDDSTDLAKQINSIPIRSNLERWWLKIDLFDMFTKNETILFDLDILILKKLHILDTVKTSALSVLFSNWKNNFINPKHLERFPTLYNSSVVKWYDDQGKIVSDYFYKHQEKYQLMYKGVDRFLYNEPLVIDTLPTSIAYSYWKGANYRYDNEESLYRSRYEICILNEGIKNHEITDWTKDYW